MSARKQGAKKIGPSVPWLTDAMPSAIYVEGMKLLIEKFQLEIPQSNVKYVVLLAIVVVLALVAY